MTFFPPADRSSSAARSSLLRRAAAAALVAFVLTGLLIGSAGCDSAGTTDPPEDDDPPPSDTTGGGDDGGDGNTFMGPVAPAPYRYGGYKKDAAWRAEAQQRIEEMRKADLSATVVDGNGDPVDGASVEVEMQEHAFNFGTAVNAGLLHDGGSASDRQKFRTRVERDFNYATIENGLKVLHWRGGGNVKQDVEFSIDWLNERDMGVRGHAAFWEKWSWMDIDQGQSGAQIHQEVKERIRPRLERFEGRVDDWDAENHPIHRQMIRPKVAQDTDLSAMGAVTEWWATSHEADTEAAMGINEMNVLQKYSGSNFVSDYSNWIQDLLDAGVAVDEIGFMSHANVTRLEGIPSVLSILDGFAGYDRPLYVSEFHVTTDADTWADASQAERDAQTAYVRDYYTALFSRSAVETVVYWNAWAGRAWRPSSTLYSRDWSLRDHGQMYRDLVYGAWWTNAEGETSGDGGYATRGFKGAYEITASKGDQSGSVTATLGDGGAAVEVTLE